MKALAAACLSACMTVAASAKADPVQIKFAYPSAPNNALFHQGAEAWVNDVNKEANGAIEIKLFPGGVIADNSNMYDRVTGGVADIGLAVFGPVSSVFPKTNVGTLPFEARNHREDALALWALYQKGLIKDEFAHFHP
jgi:TRAP-type C4-dicarboxylate transport system substrate-binding protein